MIDRNREREREQPGFRTEMGLQPAPEAFDFSDAIWKIIPEFWGSVLVCLVLVFVFVLYLIVLMGFFP